MTDDQQQRLAELDARGVPVHPYKPGQLRKRRTVCNDCGGFETDAQHDPDLIRLRPRSG